MKNKILKYIKEHKKEHGYAPDQANIGRKLDVTRQHIYGLFQEMKDELIKLYPEYKKYFTK